MKFVRVIALQAALTIGLLSMTSTPPVRAESIESKRTTVMDTSTQWLAVAYYVVGKPLTVSRSVGSSPITHDMCIHVVQRMSEAAQISEAPKEFPEVFYRCEPVELVRR